MCFPQVIDFIAKVKIWTWGVKQYEKQICCKPFVNSYSNAQLFSKNIIKLILINKFNELGINNNYNNI